MSEVIVVTSGKGGVGKTVSCVNLGIGLAQEGKKVLLIDADPQGSLTISLGYEEPDEMEYSLATLMLNIVNDEKLNMEKTTKRTDGAPTPEELAAAVEAFKKRRAERSGAATDGSAAAEPTAAPGVADNDPAAAQDKPDAVQMVKDRRDRRDSEGDPADMPGAMGVIAQQDEDIDTLLGIIDVLKAAGTTTDGAEGGCGNTQTDGDGEGRFRQ